VGALLMGRATYDSNGEHGWDWPYGETPVLVATSRPLEPMAPTVRAVTGAPSELVAAAREAAGGSAVYVDGGGLIRALVEAGLVDEAVVTLVPVLLGAGAPLFAGLATRRKLALRSATTYAGGLVQLRYGFETDAT
jgi:dihydrofolate reductase